ncbi:envelope glycoprotein G [Pteropodid alphaherpesvirus 1]|uniref:Envelope glycoprotein G n=1 Tax=Pteropodid alphaherpesvirus 1 TaxID=1343901 RepID=A0A060Q1X4_9ALPH|nr:envelope glycoprotein G [Pteropodid alphaherpesvirus 1]BAP00742.1 envelope glycoprotein G [Pteropodid alphaherpesvirus 1]
MRVTWPVLATYFTAVWQLTWAVELPPTPSPHDHSLAPPPDPAIPCYAHPQFSDPGPSGPWNKQLLAPPQRLIEHKAQTQTAASCGLALLSPPVREFTRKNTSFSAQVAYFEKSPACRRPILLRQYEDCKGGMPPSPATCRRTSYTYHGSSPPNRYALVNASLLAPVSASTPNAFDYEIRVGSRLHRGQLSVAVYDKRPCTPLLREQRPVLEGACVPPTAARLGWKGVSPCLLADVNFAYYRPITPRPQSCVGSTDLVQAKDFPYVAYAPQSVLIGRAGYRFDRMLQKVPLENELPLPPLPPAPLLGFRAKRSPEASSRMLASETPRRRLLSLETSASETTAPTDTESTESVVSTAAPTDIESTESVVSTAAPTDIESTESVVSTAAPSDTESTESAAPTEPESTDPESTADSTTDATPSLTTLSEESELETQDPAATTPPATPTLSEETLSTPSESGVTSEPEVTSTAAAGEDSPTTAPDGETTASESSTPPAAAETTTLSSASAETETVPESSSTPAIPSPSATETPETTPTGTLEHTPNATSDISSDDTPSGPEPTTPTSDDTKTQPPESSAGPATSAAPEAPDSASSLAPETTPPPSDAQTSSSESLDPTQPPTTTDTEATTRPPIFTPRLELITPAPSPATSQPPEDALPDEDDGALDEDLEAEGAGDGELPEMTTTRSSTARPVIPPRQTSPPSPQPPAVDHTPLFPFLRASQTLDLVFVASVLAHTAAVVAIVLLALRLCAPPRPASRARYYEARYTRLPRHPA